MLYTSKENWESTYVGDDSSNYKKEVPLNKRKESRSGIYDYCF